ncbi:hypothetical protein GQX73_g9132 [Xylaria multiplex]|uniref:Uncharacterized protein n=1 Tax=Xylaria multiplex TaxID=323545 RepID=A0A7C8IUX1_9PEZI|nr:hypothetical protein GQX73_g9132 [Xylaria multiplex]
MASHPEIAHTCKLPSPENASFIRFDCPDWSKIDIIGQTVILVELTSHFGSFQNTCRALKIQSNELESFLQTYLQYQQAREQGALRAEQWGREQAVPANDNEDIPQQRPVFISPSSIAPACDFLSTMGYHEHIPAVQSWSRRVVVWPPHIDVTHLDISELDQLDVDVVLPQPREQRIHSTHVSFLGDDTRALIALTGFWGPKADGTPDAHIAFVDLPNGAVVYGPRGSRKLAGAGRYSVCWPTDGLLDNQYNDLVIARNAFDHSAFQDADAFAGYKSTNRDLQFEDLNNAEGPLEETISVDSLVNPKDIFGTDIPNTYSVSDGMMNPFHLQTEPQGPSRKLDNPHLLQMWDSWPGQIFQFRLPRDYTILGPQNRVLTFDPHPHERYDDLGDPHGIGGTYLVVLPMKTRSPVSFKIQQLPGDVILRFKTSEKLVIVRNGMVLPHFVEQGVHEWSTREGFLDLYSAHGCYEVFHKEGSYSVFPEAAGESIGQGTNHEHERRDEYDDGYIGEDVANNINVATNPSPLEEASKILAPYRDWLDREEAEEMRLEREAEKRARHDAKLARDRANRDVLLEERVARKLALEEREAREQERIDAIPHWDTTMAQRVQNRRASKMQTFENQPSFNQGNMPPPKPQPRATQKPQKQRQQPIGYSTVPKPKIVVQVKATPKRGKALGTKGRRRITDHEDEDYTPTLSRPSRVGKPTSTQKTPTLRKPQAKLGNGAYGIGDPQSTPIFQGRQTRATSSQAQMGKSSIGPAPGLPSTTGRTRSSRAAVQRKPIGPLLDAIEADGAGSKRSLQPPKIPKANNAETAPDTAGGKVVGGANRMVLRVRAAKPPAALNETESDRGI